CFVAFRGGGPRVRSGIEFRSARKGITIGFVRKCFRRILHDGFSMSTLLLTPRKGFWRTFWKTALFTWIAITLLSLWLPVRVGIVKAMIRFGADRLFIGAEYDEINDPAYVSISEANMYASDTEVVAIEINGDARAIPLKRLANYLVLNDLIGGEHVTIAYCHV